MIVPGLQDWSYMLFFLNITFSVLSTSPLATFWLQQQTIVKAQEYLHHRPPVIANLVHEENVSAGTRI